MILESKYFVENKIKACSIKHNSSFLELIEIYCIDEYFKFSEIEQSVPLIWLHETFRKFRNQHREIDFHVNVLSVSGNINVR